MMAENSAVSTTMEEVACAERKWTINNWNTTHEVVVAAKASCYVEVGNPKVEIRFFLRPKEQLTNLDGRSTIFKWYSLCAEVLSCVNENDALKVTANVNELMLTSIPTLGGAVPLKKSKGRVVEVIDTFLNIGYRTFDIYGQTDNPSISRMACGIHRPIRESVTITINVQLFRSIETDKKMEPLHPDVEESLSESVEAKNLLIHDLKNKFVEHENYADIKLESKDHMTLDAHKFILAARSRYLQKCIDDAMKAENFNGTMKININGKPLVVILHWIYTGELHENSGNVMEEVVDAAISFELTQLMKLLDKKLITICNKENMFRLHQLAQKNGMPNAMDDISVYIRENL